MKENLKDVSFDKASELLGTMIPRMGTETVPLSEALGRFVARSIKADRDRPERNVGAMDGFAFASERFASRQTGESLPFRLVGEAFPETERVAFLKPSHCLYVATGAPMPEGADRLAVVESVEVKGDEVWIPDPGKKKTHVREKGSQVKNGERIVEKGKCLDPVDLSALEGLGRRKLEVFRKPRVAIFTTGSEIADPRRKASRGKIFNSNASLLANLLNKPWIELADTAHFDECPFALAERLRSLEGKIDVAITTGGVSKGKKDRVKESFGMAGYRFAFEGILAKPGKPFSAGFADSGRARIPSLALPGNPFAVFALCVVWVEPFLKACGSGRGFLFPGETGWETSRPVQAEATYHRLLPAKVESRFPPRIRLLPGGSGELYSCLKADGLASIPPVSSMSSSNDARSPVSFIPFASLFPRSG